MTTILCRTLNATVGCQKSHDTHHGLAFSGARFTHDSQRLPCPYVKVYTFYGIHRAVRRSEIDFQSANGKNGL
ncbi:hypothetical protein D3C80_2107460 [compost metagenome]